MSSFRRDFEDSYSRELARSSFPEDTEEAVNGASKEYLGLLESGLNGIPLPKNLKPIATVLVGSAPRRTYIRLPVDIDVVVLTHENPQLLSDADLARFSLVVREHLCQSIPASAGLELVAPFQKFGTASVLMRLVPRSESIGAARFVCTIEATFQSIHSTVKYEKWMQNHFAGLTRETRKALSSEIRLIKRLLNIVGAYGRDGVPGHLVEQLLVAPNPGSGEWESASARRTLRRIVDAASGCADGLLAFTRVRSQVPVVQPGSSGRIDLWRFLDPDVSPARFNAFLRLLDIARCFAEHERANGAWSVETLAADVVGRLRRATPNQPTYQGKTKEVYQSSDELRFHFSDRISILDQPIPTLVPGKGEAVCKAACHWLSLCSDIGIKTHFLRQDGPQDFIGTNPSSSRVLPVEVISRFYVAGSLLDRLRLGLISPQALGFDQGITPRPGNKLPVPLVEFTTKRDKFDRLLTDQEAASLCSLSQEEIDELKRFALTIDKVIARRLAIVGLIHVDGKKEFALDEGRDFVVVDAFGTPDEDRWWDRDAFVAGRLVGLGKESVREHYQSIGHTSAVASARRQGTVEPPIPPLPSETVPKIARAYADLAERISS